MICKKCNQDVDDTLAVCPNCGEPFEGAAPVEENEIPAVLSEEPVVETPEEEIPVAVEKTPVVTEEAPAAEEAPESETPAEVGAVAEEASESETPKEEGAVAEEASESETPEEDPSVVEEAREEEAPAAVPVYSPGNIIPPVKKKTATGLIIGLVAGGVVLLAAILFGIYFFFLNGSSPLDFLGFGGTETALDATNNSANSSLFVKAGNEYYCNLVTPMPNDPMGIYKISPNGKTKEMVLSGSYSGMVAIGQYLIVCSGEANEAGDAPTLLIDTKAKDKEPEQISASSLANLRVNGDWCYYQELSEEGRPKNIVRYNPITRKSETVYEKEASNFSINGDTIVFFLYSEETQLCTLYTYDMVTKAEAVSLGEYPIISLPLQLTEDHIYFVQAEAEATEANISRVAYTGGEPENVYEFSLMVNGAQYLVDQKGILISTFTVDPTTGIPSESTVIQLDINGKNPADVSNEIWLSLSRIAGNTFYVAFDSASQGYLFNSITGRNKVNSLFDNGLDTENPASAATVSDPPSSMPPLDPVPETKLNEDYDPKVQLAKPKKGEEIAVITTNLGVITVRFFEKQAPKAVENFKELAKQGYYDGLTFHRIIKGFMIQSGDPKGDGTGGESFWKEPFEDEFDKDLINIRGALSMANAGANTNGSQFFINQSTADDLKSQIKSWDEWAATLDLQETQAGYRNPYQPKRIPDSVRKQYDAHGGTPILDGAYQTGGGHTVFGQVIDGLDIVDIIASVEMEMTTDPTTGTEVPGDKPKTEVKIEKVEIKKY